MCIIIRFPKNISGKILNIDFDDINILLASLNFYSRFLYKSALDAKFNGDIKENELLLSFYEHCNNLFCKISDL